MWQIINGFLGNVMLMIGAFIFGKIVFNTSIKVTKKRVIIDIILSSLIHSVILLTLTGTIKTILMTIVNIVFFLDIFKESKRKIIFATFLHMILLIIPELIELFFLTRILGLSRSFCYDTYAGSIISNVMITIFMILFTYALKYLLRKVVNAKIENNTKIIIFLILIFICTGMFFYTFIKEFRFSNDIFLYIVTIIVLLSVLFSLIKQMIENQRITNEYDTLLEFMITFENEIENQRILRHEIKNEFRTVRAKIVDNQENKEIIAYIDEIVNDKYEINKEKYAKFGYLPPNGIKGLCYFKTQEAEDKGLKVALNISKRIKESSIYELSIKEQRDFGRILGVLLDNAIEASLESEEKEMGIEAYTNANSEFRLIITNTYKNEIDKNKIGKESFSTKGKNRGHGLLLVNQLVGKNKIFETKTDIQETLYIQTIIIKKL